MNLSNEYIEKRVTSVAFKIFIAVIIAVAIVTGVIGSYFISNLSPVDKNNNKEIVFEIENGWSQKKIASELKKQNLIKNESIFLLYSKINDNDKYLAGVYSLNQTMSVEDIINSISKGENLIKNTIKVTFVEGKRFTYYADVIEENLNIPRDEVIKKCSDQEYLKKLIDKYWFLTDDILNKNIYYPLEGYLFPDTYEFYKGTTIENIIEKMLDEMSVRLLTYKDEIEASKKSIHSLLTLASMVELEAVTSNDRVTLAGLFNNRIAAGITLGSDVTTYYAEQKELTSKLNLEELNRCNAYNTRGSCRKGLPVGPICSPSYTSIIASIKPGTTNYYYFVADKQRKLYYATDLAGHNANIKYLQNNNLWPE